MNCDSCAAVMIQGVYCHETGCPNMPRFECYECGSMYARRDEAAVCCAPEDAVMRTISKPVGDKLPLNTAIALARVYTMKGDSARISNAGRGKYNVCATTADDDAAIAANLTKAQQTVTANAIVERT